MDTIGFASAWINVQIQTSKLQAQASNLNLRINQETGNRIILRTSPESIDNSGESGTRRSENKKGNMKNQPCHANEMSAMEVRNGMPGSIFTADHTITSIIFRIGLAA